jgi:hypothetical protein
MFREVGASIATFDKLMRREGEEGILARHLVNDGRLMGRGWSFPQ